jgi:hypothetical protein
MTGNLKETLKISKDKFHFFNNDKIPISASYVDDSATALGPEEVDQEVFIVNGPLGLVADVQLPDLSSLAVGILVSYSLKEKKNICKICKF